jgi:uncharacterized repeat protein (TIGR03803 family)
MTTTLVTAVLVLGALLVAAPARGQYLKTIHSFSGMPGPIDPNSSLIQASDGNFYGATARGGLYDAGVIYQLTPAGTMTPVHVFSRTDGLEPSVALIQASDGNFYGATARGGLYDAGVIYQLTPAGTKRWMNRGRLIRQ